MKVLFFDMDGTLIDSLPVAFRVYEEVMRELGYEPSYEEFIAWGSKSPREAILSLAKRIGPKADPVSLGKLFRERLTERYSEDAPLFPGTLEMLKAMRELDRPMFLVTAADYSVAHAVVERHSLNMFFEEIITPEKLEASKPHPAIYLHALERAKARPQEGVAFEDSHVGMRSAKGAGLRSVWMNHKEEDFGKEHTALVDHTFTNWHSATTWLKDGIKTQNR